MTVHAGARRLDCHHCGARATRPPACPDCGSLGLQPQGFGTERLEEALAARFPDVPLIRVDRETTRHRDAIEKHLQQLGDASGILVGTQMLAKGHDLPRLTLVAVVGVDEGLYSADFRAGERLSQLLIQVAGRAGRALLPGEVLLQTHHPEHPLLLTLLGGGYPAVAALELAQREAAGFPPYDIPRLVARRGADRSRRAGLPARGETGFRRRRVRQRARQWTDAGADGAARGPRARAAVAVGAETAGAAGSPRHLGAALA